MPLAAELWGRWLRGLYKYGPFSQAADAQTVPQCRELAHAPCTTRMRYGVSCTRSEVRVF